MMDKKTLLVEGVVNKTATYVDKSHKIELVTGELTREQAGNLNELLQMAVTVYISAGEIPTQVIKQVDAHKPDPDKGTKTPGQRLRAVLYRVWEQGKEPGTKGRDDNQYYDYKMEEIIEHLKSKLA